MSCVRKLYINDVRAIKGITIGFIIRLGCDIAIVVFQTCKQNTMLKYMHMPHIIYNRLVCDNNMSIYV